MSGAQDKASCERTTVSDPVNTILHSPAGQEKREKAKNLETFSGERSKLRATSSKVRLAANFTFPLNEKR